MNDIDPAPSPRPSYRLPPRATDPDVAGPSYVIISGGTGANSIASAFGPSPAFVLPVSDDGGSSAEILRCFGGPSIGDIRSRLSRLIPLPDHARTKEEKEQEAIYNLMSYRFPVDAPERIVKDIWMDIVEGKSELWQGIGDDRKELIRAFLVHFQTLSLRRAHKRFSFRNFSLGNGFLTGARDLFGSLPSAIFLFKSIAGVDPSVQVIPVINTNQTVIIAAQLVNGDTLVGQCNISHPTVNPTTVGLARQRSVVRHGSGHGPALHVRRDSRTFDTADTPSPLVNAKGKPWDAKDSKQSEDTDEPGNLNYTKGQQEIPLEARIERIFYINLYGQEIFPDPNPDFMESLSKRDVLVYSCGSLFTSIVPCLTLRGLATAISTSPSLKAKVLLLNSDNDRETPKYTASEYASTILEMLRRYDKPRRPHVITSDQRASRLITHVVYLEGGNVRLDETAMRSMGIQMVKVPRHVLGVEDGQLPLFTPDAVEWAMNVVLQGSADRRM